ncbi:MAG: hemerythrin domain-containing protein [Magnetococcales bacterium]|nr:hemerythrin domain-containing protein [Magnetococcales bacterium]
MRIVDTLDLTDTPPAQRSAALIAVLDALPVGASRRVQLAAPWAVDGGHLLADLQEQRWGHYLWHPLQEGPELWLAELVRQEPAARHNNIPHFFTQDHHRCDTLYAAAEGAAQDGDVARMTPLCYQFVVAMARHFRMEENGLFPAFEEKTGIRQGPTMVMRSEHEQMRGLMRQMHQAADDGDADQFLRAGGTLLFVMQQHNVKEEQMLYPMSESHLHPSDHLLKAVQRL